MFIRFINWLIGRDPVAPPAPEVLEPRQSFFSTDIVASTPFDAAVRAQQLQARIFPRTVADTQVVDVAGGTFAMDAAEGGSSLKAAYALSQNSLPEAQALWYAAQSFIGYQMCAIIAQHWFVDKACALPARDAVRKGYKFTANDGSKLTPEMQTAIKKANKRLKLNQNLVEFVKMGRVFGVRVALCVVESTDPDYYVKPFNPDGITPGSYKGITQVDPYWIVPELTNATANNPTARDFYEPTYWVIGTQRYHKSHLIIFRGPEVADILKPAYLYGGLSVPQRIYERVYASERTANEAPQLALTKRAMVFYTDTAKALANQEKFESRLSIWAYFRDNFGVKVADKEADKVEQHDTSLADLDAVIMSQYHLACAIAEVPVTKMMGTQLKGFSTGEGEESSYHESLESVQTNDMEPLADRHMICLMRSEIAPKFGIAPVDLDVVWETLDSLTAAEAAAIRKTNAETDKILAVDIGAVGPDEVRARLAADENSGYDGLEIESNEENQTDLEA